MLKRIFLLVLVFSISLFLFSFIVKEKKQKAFNTIIIDAGHGGSDGGARGSYSHEKDICLDIALQLGAQLQKELPDVKILYTRVSDIYPELHARANFANQNKGDLFVSIHVNAAPAIRHREFTGNKMVTSHVGKGKKRRKVTRKVAQYRYYSTPNPAKGTETYIWGAHKNEDKEVAMRENAPMISEENYKDNYGDIDPNSPEFIALSLLKTKQYFKRSATLAGFVQDEFVRVGRIDRDVRQRPAGIWVLQATAMPSILVETGFISNREDEDYLNSKDGQTEIAICITNALKNYVAWIEKQGHGNELNTTLPDLSAGNNRAFLDMIQQKENQTFSK